MGIMGKEYVSYYLEFSSGFRVLGLADWGLSKHGAWWAYARHAGPCQVSGLQFSKPMG